MATTDSIRSDDVTEMICDGITNTTIAFLPKNINIDVGVGAKCGVCQNTNTDFGVGA